MKTAERERLAFQTAHPEAVEITRLVLELIHIGHGIRSTIAHAPLLADGANGLSQQAVRAAITIYLAGEPTMGEIASSVGRSNAWASRAVDELIAAGIAERLPDASDRRVTRVRLAPAAVDAVEQAYRWRGDAIARALSELDATSRAAVRSFLARAVAELSAE